MLIISHERGLRKKPVPVRGGTWLPAPQFGKMVENLVNCTQYQTKKLTPFYQVGSESGVIDWDLGFLKGRIHNFLPNFFFTVYALQFAVHSIFNIGKCLVTSHHPVYRSDISRKN